MLSKPQAWLTTLALVTLPTVFAGAAPNLDDTGDGIATAAPAGPSAWEGFKAAFAQWWDTLLRDWLINLAVLLAIVVGGYLLALATAIIAARLLNARPIPAVHFSVLWWSCIGILGFGVWTYVHAGLTFATTPWLFWVIFGCGLLVLLLLNVLFTYPRRRRA